MTAAITPGQEELARDLALAFHGDEVEWGGFLPKAALILSNQSYRLAANPSPDPDAMNERCAAEDARLAANVREATIEECAKAAKNFDCEYQNSPSTKAGIIDAIRALSTTGEPKR